MIQNQPPPLPPSTPARRFTDGVQACETSIRRGLHVKGDLAAASLELAGSLEGSVVAQSLCHVREEGRVSGRITAGDVLVEGEVQGRIIARGKVELRARARVRADIEATTVAIAEGSFFDGRIHMPSGLGSPGLAFQEKRQAQRSSTPDEPQLD